MGSDWKNLPGTAQFLSTQTDRHVQEGMLNTKTTPCSHGFKIYRPEQTDRLIELIYMICSPSVLLSCP